MVKASRSFAYLGHLEEKDVAKNGSEEKTHLWFIREFILVF